MVILAPFGSLIVPPVSSWRLRLPLPLPVVGAKVTVPLLALSVRVQAVVVVLPAPVVAPSVKVLLTVPESLMELVLGVPPPLKLFWKVMLVAYRFPDCVIEDGAAFAVPVAAGAKTSE
jgi:hypothetical protein